MAWLRSSPIATWMLVFLSFPPIAQQAILDQDIHTGEPSRSHSDIPHFIGILWLSDQPATATSTWQHTTLTRQRHRWPLEDPKPQTQQASGHRPPGHWDRQEVLINFIDVASMSPQNTISITSCTAVSYVSRTQGEWWVELGVCVMCFMETQLLWNNYTLTKIMEIK